MTTGKTGGLSRGVRAHYAALVVASGIFLVAIFFLFQTLFKQNDLIEQQSRVNVWFVAQTEIEYLNFVDTLDRFAIGDERATKDALIECFEIFWSRLPVILKEDSSKKLRLVEGLVETASAIFGKIQEIEPALSKVGREDSAELTYLRQELEALRVPLQQMVRNALLFNNTTLSADRRSQEAAYHQLLSLFAVVLGAGVVLFFLLHREALKTQKQAARRSAMLQATVDNIAQAVLVVVSMAN